VALLLLAVAPALVARAEPPPAARSFVMSPLTITLDDEKPGDSPKQPEMWPADPLPERTRGPSWEARPFWENFSVLGGLDGAKGPEDLGISANFGYRVAVQTAGPLVAEWGLGVQIGTGVDYHRTATRFLHLLADVHDRTQSFSTLGIFQRTESGLSWGVAYDYLAERYYTHFDIGQWRGQVGLELNPANEIGVWGTLRDKGDSALVGGQVLSLEAINQVNLFLRHTWPTGVMTRAWAGVAEQHGRFVLGGPAYAPTYHPFVFGAEVFIPLNERWAIFGEANFITPNDSGTVTAFLGLVYYPGAGALGALRNRFAPLLPVANNPNFGVNLQP
jgi:hypothetical protein